MKQVSLKSKKPILSAPAFVLLLSFFLPIAVLCIVYRNFGIYPFGEKSLLIMDLNGQSVDFYAYIRGMVTQGNGLSYSFAKGLGGNMIGLLGYYGNLPTLFLTVLFPAERMTEAILVIHLLKAGCAGLSMCVLLRSLWKRWDVFEAALSVCYALCTYSIIYAMQFQWMAGLVYLPLIVLGINRIIEKEKWGTFVLFYTILLFSNTYTAFMVTIFSVLYFLWYSVSYEPPAQAPRKKQKKQIASKWVPKWWKKLIIFAASGVGSVALSAVWTVPSFLAIRSGRADMVAFEPKDTITWNIGNIYQKFFVGQYDSITNTVKETAGTPSIFCGILVLALLGYYFASRHISVKEKLASGGMLLIFALSVRYVALDKAWHLFSYPNWFPCRWAFIMVFFAVLLGARALKETEITSAHGIGMIAVFAVLYILYISHDKEKFSNPKLATFSLVLVLVYGALLFLRAKAPDKFALPDVVALGITFLVCVEMALSGLTTVKGLDGQFHYKNREEYVSAVTQTGDAVEQIKKMDTAPFYRVEKTYLRSDNDAMNHGYYGLTHYSSSFDKGFNDLDKSLGMIQEWYACRYQGGTPVIDTVFGIKYLISRGFAPTDSYPIRWTKEDVGIYENPNPFPLGFVASGDLVKPNYTGNFLENQNAFYRSLTGHDVWLAEQAASQNQSEYTLTVTEEKPLYLSLANEKVGGGITVFVNGEETSPRDSGETKCKLLGTFPIGTELAVRLPKVQPASFAYLDEAELESTASEMQKNGLQISEFSDTHIKGNVNVANSGTFVTTIAYDEGWKVKVDGKTVETQKAEDVFLAFPLNAGEHTVEMTYCAPGCVVGCVLSIAAFLCLLALTVGKRVWSAKTKKSLE